MTSEDLICNVKVFNVDDKLIYESTIELTTTIFSLKISLHTQTLLNIQPSDQQILFNDRELSNSTTFQQIYNLNNRNKSIKLQAIQSKKHWYSGLSTHAFSGDARRISYDTEVSSQHSNESTHMFDINETIQMRNTYPAKRKYSQSDTASVGDNTTNSPFFARRGSMSVTGPATLRCLLHSTTGGYMSGSQRGSPSPQQFFLNDGDNISMFQPIPNKQGYLSDSDLSDNSDYYQHRRGTERVKLRDTQRGARKSVDRSANQDGMSADDHEAVGIEYDKLDNDWKTSWKGILLIGGIWSSSFHNLYSFCCLSMNLMNIFNILIFDIGLLYCFIFCGISIGILVSSIVLNQPSMVQSSQMIVTHSIFVVFLAQAMSSIVIYYMYYYKHNTINMICWSMLLASRFLLGVSIGFIETAIDNLLFEWFVIVDEMYFISKARPYTLLLKEFGHCSARLILVPIVYITSSNYSNSFFALLVGVILSALSWLSMIYAAIKDSKLSLDRNAHNINVAKYTIEGEYEKQTKPLLPQTYTMTRNEWMMKGITCDILSYKKWNDMGYIGFNMFVFWSIAYLSLNFAISFTFIILSITAFVEQYGYTNYTANLLLCLIPIINVTCNGLIRDYILSPLKSEWMVAFIGAISFSIIFSLLSWLHITGLSSIWLPIVCILLFVFGYECFTAAGYELLLTATKQEIHALISSVNSTANYLFSAVFVIIFSILIIEDDQNVNITFKYQWAYSFLAFASYFNIVIVVLLKLYHSDSTEI